MQTKIMIFIFIISISIIQCVTYDSSEGLFPDTNQIEIVSNTSTSLKWITSFKDYEVIMVITTQTIQLNGTQIDSTSFSDSVDTKYWRLSFGQGQNGSIDPTTDLSDSISSFTSSAGLPGAGPWNWLIWAYDQNGNLVRSSQVHSFS